MDVQHGDVLLFERGSKRGTLLGRTIRLVTGSRYTHCAIVIEDLSGQLFIAEQDGAGLATKLENYVPPTDSPVTVWRNPALSWKNHDKVVEFVWRSVGASYGTANLFEILWQHTLGLVMRTRPWEPTFLPADRDLCTCAGYVAKVINIGAGEQSYTKFTTIMEPDDFSTHGFVQITIEPNTSADRAVLALE